MTATIALDPARRNLITVAVMLASLMTAIDSTIANVALPHIQASMSASQDQVIWVLTSYLIASAIATPLGAWLASRYGRKRMMLISITGFTLSSLACGMVANLPMLVFARIVQGFTGAGMVPLSQAMLFDIYPPAQQGKAMAIFGIGTMFGPLIGPTLGGWLTDSFSWRWVFLINLPFGLISVLGLILFMKETRKLATMRFDLFGFAALSIFLGALQLMMDRGQQLDWFDSIEIRFEAAIMVLCGYMTVVHMLTARNSFVPPHIFRDRNFVLGCVISTAIGVVVFAGIPAMVTMMKMLGYPALLTGLLSSPRGIGTLISMVIVSRLINRLDMRLFLFIGLALNAVGLSMLAHLSLQTDQMPILIAGLLQGLGAGLMFVPLSTTVLATLAPVFRNEGAAIYVLMRAMGTSVGMSFLQGRTITSAAQVQSRLTEGVRLDNPMLAWHLPEFTFAANQPTALLQGLVARQAYMVGLVDLFWMLALVAVAMVPVVALLRPPRQHLEGEP